MCWWSTDWVCFVWVWTGYEVGVKNCKTWHAPRIIHTPRELPNTNKNRAFRGCPIHISVWSPKRKQQIFSNTHIHVNSGRKVLHVQVRYHLCNANSHTKRHRVDLMHSKAFACFILGHRMNRLTYTMRLVVREIHFLTLTVSKAAVCYIFYLYCM